MLSMHNKIIGDYQIIEHLGGGAMGIVYKARDLQLQRDVALKMLSPMLAYDKEFVERFKREAQSLARIEDPHIVTIYAFRETEFGSFIAMQYVDGATLAKIIQQKGSYSWEEALPIYKDIVSAIGNAHRVGVIHRDLKPGNIMISQTGHVKITDFGLAKIQSDKELTRTMTAAGTLFYMSPEQLVDLKSANHLSDIYSLGMVFYEMLAGRTPFNKTDTDLTNQQKIIKGNLPAVTHFNTAIPKSLAAIIQKAIQKDPTKRYQNAGEMLSALEEFEREQKSPDVVPKPRPVLLRYGIMALALLVTVVIIFGIFNRPEKSGREEIQGVVKEVKKTRPIPDATATKTNETEETGIQPGLQQEKTPESWILDQTDSRTGIVVKPKPETTATDASISATMPQNILEAPHIELQPGDRLLRLAVVQNSERWQQLVTTLQRYQDDLFYLETSASPDHKILYLRLKGSDLSVEAKNYLGSIGIKQGVIEKLIIYRNKPVLTFENNIQF